MYMHIHLLYKYIECQEGSHTLTLYHLYYIRIPGLPHINTTKVLKQERLILLLESVEHAYHY